MPGYQNPYVDIPHQSEILEIWKSLGYENATHHELTGGIVEGCPRRCGTRKFYCK